MSKPASDPIHKEFSRPSSVLKYSTILCSQMLMRHWGSCAWARWVSLKTRTPVLPKIRSQQFILQFAIMLCSLARGLLCGQSWLLCSAEHIRYFLSSFLLSKYHLAIQNRLINERLIWYTFGLSIQARYYVTHLLDSSQVSECWCLTLPYLILSYQVLCAQLEAHNVGLDCLFWSWATISCFAEWADQISCWRVWGLQCLLTGLSTSEWANGPHCWS